MNATLTRSAYYSSVLMLGVHVALWGSWMVAMAGVVPRFERVFADFNMKLPASTAIVVSLSELLSQSFFLLPILVMGLVVCDGAILFFLRQGESTRKLFGFYSVLVIVLAFTAWIYSISALILPLVEVQSPLSPR